MSNAPPSTQPDPEGGGALRAAAPSTLPMPLTSFIGRATEVEEVRALLDDAAIRLVTLTGPGGTGKTRLALEVARSVEHDFADGATFVPLAPIRDPELVLLAVATSLGVREHGGRPLVDLLIGELRDRHLLLVLDNFEHLLARTPTWLTDLLVSCLRVTALVTSRIALNIGGEQRYLVPPLAVSTSGAASEATEPAAVTLFRQRARAVRADYAIDHANKESVGEICRRLDGLPLAIELAAARVTSLSSEAILSRLNDRFSLLSGGQRDAPARLRAMSDAIAWSYDLLTPDEQQVFQQVCVFVGGFTVEAAERVCESFGLDTIATVGSLVDKSLLRMVGGGMEARYIILETIREFGLAQLAASSDEEAARQRHAGWCLALTRTLVTEEQVPPWRPGRAVIDRLDLDHGNLRTALIWLDDTGRSGELAELVIQLSWFWYLTGRWSEGLGLYERILTKYPGTPANTRIDAYCWAGVLAQTVGSPQAPHYLAEALRLSREVGDANREGQAVTFLAVMAEDRGDYPAAEAQFRIAREIFRQGGHNWWRTLVDYHLGVVTYGKGEVTTAVDMLESARSAAMAIGDQFVAAWAVSYLALIACERADFPMAADLLRHRQTGEAAALRHDDPYRLRAAMVLASTTANHVSAARLCGAAERSEGPIKLPERAAHERAAQEIKRQLGNETFSREWAIGRSMRDEQLAAEVDRLLSGAGERPELARPSAQMSADLTPRELDVLHLLTGGLTNQQIAEKMYISRKTVAHHVAHILAKLGVASRTAAVSYAIRHQLA